MVHLTDVKVPVENRVGEEGKAWTYAKGLLAHERTGLAGISRSLVALEKLKRQASSVNRGNGSLLDDPSYRMKLAELEVDLMATEFTELRSLASAAAGAEPGPESSILKLKGTEIQQRVQKLTVEAGGITQRLGALCLSATSSHTVVCPVTWQVAPIPFMAVRLEVQRDVIAKNVLGLKK